MFNQKSAKFKQMAAFWELFSPKISKFFKTDVLTLGSFDNGALHLWDIEITIGVMVSWFHGFVHSISGHRVSMIEMAIGFMVSCTPCLVSWSKAVWIFSKNLFKFENPVVPPVARNGVFVFSQPAI